VSGARRFDLVAFDVDGTLVDHPEEKTVWEVLHRRFGTPEGVERERYALYKAGKLSYAEWVALDVSSWRDAGATREAILEALPPLALVPGARETLDALKADGMRLAVISGTLDLLLDALFPDHPFDEVYTNRITFREDGTIAGWWATPFDMEGKGVALRAIAAREEVPLSRCAFVGDHANDLSAFRLAGLALAFNPKNDEVAAAAHAVVRARDLRTILLVIRGQVT
jgi:phosphoserine phosphatase